MRILGAGGNNHNLTHEVDFVPSTYGIPISITTYIEFSKRRNNKVGGEGPPTQSAFIGRFSYKDGWCVKW